MLLLRIAAVAICCSAGFARAQGSAAGARLWRERSPEAAPLPDFVPPTSLAPLIRSVSRSVVNVSTVGVAEPADGGEAESLGSGFIISSSGYVVTNNHVVEKGQQIAVRLEDGREFFAELIGRDASTDVALLKLKGNDVRDLPYTFLGNSDKLEVATG